nr:MAG TPA: hypothetical protein [Caudoviricetes sp.]DAS23506.1 MAG TPA: hypothetical protein [Caudoviricetes sp.]
MFLCWYVQAAFCRIFPYLKSSLHFSIALCSKIMNICNDLDIFCQYSRLSLNSWRAFR